MRHDKPFEISKIRLNYDSGEWEEFIPQPANTLQIFITNNCNLSCAECFYKRRLGTGKMSLIEYSRHLDNYIGKFGVKKITLLGGEPTMHPQIKEIIALNTERKLKTTIYTNGYFLCNLMDADLSLTSIRLSVYGLDHAKRPLNILRKNNNFVPIIVFMVDKNNASELLETALRAENIFGCSDFYISSIRDIDKTGSYWIDTDNTLPLEQYAGAVNEFVREYTERKGKMNLHISTRGILFTDRSRANPITSCRFGNIFPGGDTIICPFDISSFLRGDIKEPEKLEFGRPGDKHDECLLTKIVLKRRI